MTLELWQLTVAAFAVAAFFTAATAWVIGKPTYAHGYTRATEDTAQALITVHIVAERAWRADVDLSWRQVVAEMRTVPGMVLKRRDHEHFEFLDAAEQVVFAAIRPEKPDAR